LMLPPAPRGAADARFRAARQPGGRSGRAADAGRWSAGSRRSYSLRRDTRRNAQARSHSSSCRPPAAQLRLVPALGQAAPALQQLAGLGPGHDDLVGHAQPAALLAKGFLFGAELAGALLAEQGLLGRPLQLHAARAAIPQENQIRRAWGELAVTL